MHKWTNKENKSLITSLRQRTYHRHAKTTNSINFKSIKVDFLLCATKNKTHSHNNLWCKQKLKNSDIKYTLYLLLYVYWVLLLICWSLSSSSIEANQNIRTMCDIFIRKHKVQQTIFHFCFDSICMVFAGFLKVYSVFLWIGWASWLL